MGQKQTDGAKQTTWQDAVSRDAQKVHPAPFTLSVSLNWSGSQWPPRIVGVGEGVGAAVTIGVGGHADVSQALWASSHTAQAPSIEHGFPLDPPHIPPAQLSGPLQNT